MDVKSVIKEKGYTLTEVASKLGISRVAFSQSITKNPSVKTLRRVADVLGCGVWDFFTDERADCDYTPQTFKAECPYCRGILSLTLAAVNKDKNQESITSPKADKIKFLLERTLRTDMPRTIMLKLNRVGYSRIGKIVQKTATELVEEGILKADEVNKLQEYLSKYGLELGMTI